MDADAELFLTPESAPNSERDPDTAEFAALHGPALRASGVPERYWGRLLYKLEHEVRAGATRGRARRGAGPGPVGVGPPWTLVPGRVWSARAESCRGAAAEKPAWVSLGRTGRPPGGHVQTV